ncbi:MAG: phage holin family protein [Parcubacteria group bacterium]|nr:phage holin family protein [Parcubacteria group bacterium]
MIKFIAQIFVNAVAIFLADYLVPGFIFEGDILTLLIAGLLLGLMNVILRPILRFISTPFIILSLGLFFIVINIGLLWLLEYLVDELTIVGIWAYVWGVVIISFVNMVFGTGRKKKKD